MNTRSLVVAGLLATCLAVATPSGSEPPAGQPAGKGKAGAGQATAPAAQASRTPPGMVLVPEGEFWMGSPVGKGNFDEYPQRQVWVDAFTIDRHETTNEEYKRFCDITGRAYPSDPPWDYQYFASKPRHPVINVTWNDARDYCAWLGKRLPTEAEWEKAARGGADRKEYPWGDEFDCRKANCDDETKRDPGAVPGASNCDGRPETAPVGSYDPNGFGLYDMAGNVWEWCSDWYLLYVNQPVKNPEGPKAGRAKVVRGGSWYSAKAAAFRCANRYKAQPGYGQPFVGVRCAGAP